MSISSSDIKLKLSETTGPGNSNPGTPMGSLGGFISQTEVVSATLHNLFDEVSGAENLAQESEYRCLFVHNSNANTEFQNVRVFIPTQVAGGADAAVGVDPAAASAIGSATAQAEIIADEDTAPEGVSFTTPTDYAGGAILGNLGPGQCRAVWVRRTTTNSPAMENDGATIRVQGESL